MRPHLPSTQLAEARGRFAPWCGRSCTLGGISRGSPVALSREPNQWVRPFGAEGYPTFGLGFAEVPHGHPFLRDCTRPEGYHKGRLSFLSSGEPSLV